MLDVARLLGLEAYGTASVGKHDLVRQLGDVPIDYRNQGFVARIMELTGDGVDLVVDPIGRENLNRSFRTLRKGVQLVSTAALSKMMGDMTTPNTFSGRVPHPMRNLSPDPPHIGPEAWLPAMRQTRIRRHHTAPLPDGGSGLAAGCRESVHASKHRLRARMAA
jgi:NADPH:quinone reductase-like Zn-dependent oxidoreductase